jgi:site-specific DNA-cytosine methylase
MLDLFSGTGSTAKVFRAKGYEVTTLDNNPKFQPDILTDIMGWNFEKAFPEDYFDVIIASPPCTEYSAAMTCRARDLEMADQIVQRTMAIINHFQPRHWFIENPKTGLLKGRPFMKEYAFVDVDYCQFSSWGYQKPTRIWGPAYLRNLKSRVCDQKTCTNIIVRSSGHSGHRRVLGATP